MNCRVWLVGLSLLACQGKGSEGAGSASASALAVAASSTAPAVSGTKGTPSRADGTCQAPRDYLVAPRKYGDSDLVRAIVVDGDQAFFRNMDEAFRVPLAGGEPVSLGKAPALSLSGRAVLWVSGDKLLTQSPGEPIFMSTAKTGGAWSNFLDLTAAKLGGGRDAATRILQGIGKQGVPGATAADFDGQTFHFAEVTRGKGPNAPAKSAIKSVALSGGEPRTLYQADGEIRDVTRAGGHLAFLLTSPPTPQQVRENEAQRKAKKYVFGVKGESHLMSVPVAGGDAKKLLRIAAFMSGLGMGGVVLGADGDKLYVSGYRDEDLQKPGIFRVDAGGAGVEAIDSRVLSGSAFVSGDTLVLIGGSMVEPNGTRYGQLVLTAPRQGKSLTLVSCTPQPHTLHASAVSGKTALLGLLEGSTGLASIAKVLLP